MRVTIGERIGLKKDGVKVLRTEISAINEDAVPVWIEPDLAGPVVNLAHATSATIPWGHPETRPEDDAGPARVTGHMEFIHKTAPTLVIHGRDVISPEEYAAGRRR